MMRSRIWCLTCAPPFAVALFAFPLILLRCRPSSGDPEDLWDFGTVRHAGRPATIGRSNPIQVSGPPLTWENNGTSRTGSSNDSGTWGRRGASTGSSGSAIKYSPSIHNKGELPPLPPSPATPRKFDQQATVRHQPPSAPDYSSGSRMSQRTVTVQREPSDEYDDYDDQYTDAYPPEVDAVAEKMSHAQLDEEVPDTTMLDSVILPAIASVRSPRLSLCVLDLIGVCSGSFSLEFLHKKHEWL